MTSESSKYSIFIGWFSKPLDVIDGASLAVMLMISIEATIRLRQPVAASTDLLNLMVAVWRVYRRASRVSMTHQVVLMIYERYKGLSLMKDAVGRNNCRLRGFSLKWYAKADFVTSARVSKDQRTATGYLMYRHYWRTTRGCRAIHELGAPKFDAVRFFYNLAKHDKKYRTEQPGVRFQSTCRQPLAGSLIIYP
jgi:hypothetical protein